MSFFKKIPNIKRLAPVYAIVATAIYAWSMLQFFWHVPSLFNFLSVGEILVIFAYLETVNLIESLFVFAFIISLFLFLPPAWVYDQIIAKAVLIATAWLGFLIYRNYYAYPEKVFYELPLIQGLSLLAVAIFILVAPLNKIPAFCRAIESLADRFVVFLYVTIPISLASLIIVVYRNLF